MRDQLKRILGVMLNVESVVATAAYVLTAGLLLGDIIARELFDNSIWGAQRIAVYAAIVAGMLGMVMATAENAHLRPTFADALAPFKWTERIGDAVAAIIFVILGVVAAIFVMGSYEYNEKAEVIFIILWPIQLVLPYAFFASAFRHFCFAYDPELKPAPAGEA